MGQVRFIPDAAPAKSRIRFMPDTASSPASTTVPSDTGTIQQAPGMLTDLYRSGKARLKDLVSGGVDLLKGGGKGVMNTSLGVSRLTGSVPPNTTLEDIGMKPSNPTQEAGMMGEQFAEFFLPSGEIGKAGKGLEAATAGIKGNRLLNAVRSGINLAGKSGLEAAAAGSIAKTHGESFESGAIPAALGPAIGEVAGHFAPKIYRAALKPSTTLRPDKIAELIDTGLTEKIPVSGSGRNKLIDLIDELNGRVHGMLDPNVKILPSDIASRADQAVPTYDKFHQANPEADVRAIQKAKAEFLRQHQIPGSPAIPPSPTGILDAYGRPVMSTGTPAIPPRDIPIASPDVQNIKSGTYKHVKFKQGTPVQLPPAAEAGQKAIARGAKEELEAAFPDIREINAREGRAISLKDVIERATNRIENRDVIGIGAPIAATATHAMGGPGALVGGLKLLPPNITSRLAIEMAAASKRPISPFAAALAEMLLGKKH